MFEAAKTGEEDVQRMLSMLFKLGSKNQHFKKPHELCEHKSVERMVLAHNNLEPIELPEGSEEVPATFEASTQFDDAFGQELQSLKERNMQLINETHQL